MVPGPFGEIPGTIPQRALRLPGQLTIPDVAVLETESCQWGQDESIILQRITFPKLIIGLLPTSNWTAQSTVKIPRPWLGEAPEGAPPKAAAPGGGLDHGLGRPCGPGKLSYDRYWKALSFYKFVFCLLFLAKRG